MKYCYRSVKRYYHYDFFDEFSLFFQSDLKGGEIPNKY